MKSIPLLSSEAGTLAFTPLYLQFHVPALRISSKLTFKLKPGSSNHIFKAIEDVVLTFADNFRDDLASIDQNEIVQEFATMSERAVQSLEEWQEFVDEWKATLIGRLGELHKEVISSNEKVLAAQASEKEVTELLRAKDNEITALLKKGQMQATESLQLPLPPLPPQGSRRPSNASPNLGAGSSMGRFALLRRMSNLSIQSSSQSSSLSDPSATRPQSLPQIRRRLSFGNVMSGIGSAVGNSIRRKSDSCVPLTIVPISALHPDLINAENTTTRAGMWPVAQPKDNSTIEVFSVASSSSNSVRGQKASMQASDPESHSSDSDEDDASSISSLSLPREERASVETKVVYVGRPTAEVGSQCTVPVCHRAVQCTLFTEVSQCTPIGFLGAIDLTYVKHRGAGSAPFTPRLPAVRRFAPSHCSK